MTDTQELRKLAEAAALIDHNERAEWYSEESMVTYAFFPKNARFIAACTPQTVIALLDTIEAQAALLKQCKTVLESCATVFDEDEEIAEALAAIEQWENGK